MRGAIAGMNGATASPTSRHASTRSPSTARSRAAAASSPAFAALCERPRLLGVDRLVGAAARTPRAPRARRAAGSRRAAPRTVRSVLRPAFGQRRRRRPARGRRPLAVEVAVDHRDRAVHEVAEVVREVGVVAAHERVPRDVGVAVERDLAERHVAGRRRRRTRRPPRRGRGSCRGSCSSSRPGRS